MRLVRLLVVLGIALLFGQGVALMPASGGPASPAPVHYWVVGEPRDGQREYLYEIAMHTLGDGNRYPEILALNRDRPQPDGGRLTDALTPLRPGWILKLPPDARGPGVRIGVPPMPDRGGANASTGRGGALAYLLPATGVAAVVVAVGLFRRSRRTAPAAPPVAVAPETPPAGPVNFTTVLESLTAEPGYRLDVRLLGADQETRAIPYRWVMEGDPPPEAQLPVVFGRRTGRLLVLDLAAVPDVLTITGRPALARPQAIDLVEQVSRAGVTVVVVGDVLGGDAPAGTTATADFASASAVVDQLPGPVVIVCGGLRGAQLAAARGLAARTRHRAVPVLIGEVIRARWSVTVNRVRSVTT
ncbi:hypothetical protein F4558_001257 [Micromonospora profundi]|uniref:hypothetical protein n=1 Tax=Micromonospora profundi TaxID=1420889 RepID=UPI001439D565|nr:hypothetical protein [Micromonospora profundi]NJC11431.1 hypothetical protein [Micromonospora profundi]